jgi:hypothetical protein
LWPNVLLVPKIKSLVSRVSSIFEQFPSDFRITKFDANISICFICEQSVPEDEKLLLSDETVRVHRKCQRSYADERTSAVAAKRKASSEQRYLHVSNKLI